MTGVGIIVLAVFVTNVLTKRDVNVLHVKELRNDVENGKDIDALFSDFKRIFHSDYIDKHEDAKRKQIFENKVKFIRKHNKRYARGEKSYTLGVNQFSDLTHKEFMEMYTLERRKRKHPPRYATNTTAVSSVLTDMPDVYSHLANSDVTSVDPQTHTTENKSKPAMKASMMQLRTTLQALSPNISDVPPTVDWREKGYVTDVKDQGDCGSCWAFSIVGTLEAQVFNKTGKLVSLSAQQLVDCSRKNLGCNGGWIEYGMEYITHAGGLQTEVDYPYFAEDRKCQFQQSNIVQGTYVEGFINVPANELSLQEAVATVGPVSVGMDINPEEMQSYSGGVFYEPSCSSAIEDLDHAVIVVGYGTSSEDYWLIKNSMGTSWGDEGYMKVARNKGNNCGIATHAVYPIVGDRNSAALLVNYVKGEHLFFIIMFSILTLMTV